MKTLVAFYSRADENYFGGLMKYIKVGNTEKVALMIKDILNADLFKIEQAIPYSADYRSCINEAKKDLENNARPKLKSYLDNLDGYDEIYLGYPNYWGTMPMAVYTFLEKYDFANKTIHPFCTNEGSGLSSSINDIKNAAKGAKVTNGLSIIGSNVDSAQSKVQEWINR